MRYFYVNFLCLFIGFCSQSTAQISEDGNYALFFAVNEYDHLNNLQNPIGNSESIAKILEEDYGFHTEVIKNPSRQLIREKIEAYRDHFQNHPGGAFPYEGQLLIFFSGHGEKEYGNGFFMPSDADPSDLTATALNYVYYRSSINEINCQHILVAIDACYSVRFDPNWSTRSPTNFSRPGEKGEKSQIIAGHEEKKSRIFFTSDGEEQQTPDRSSFARKFEEGLMTYGGDGLLTSSELYGVLANAVPKPHTGHFGDDQPGSSFLFIRTSALMDENDIAAWQNATSRNTIAGYQSYQESFPQGQFFQIADEKIEEINRREAIDRDIAAWNRAKRMNTREAYQFYLSEYPFGAFSDLAHQGVNRLTADIPNGMIVVDGGRFRMGDAFGEGDQDELPLHEVSLDNFLLGKYEVSVGEFKLFIGETGYRTTADIEGGSYVWNISSSSWQLVEGVNWRHDANGEPHTSYDVNHPVIHVSWMDAIHFCNWKSKSEKLEPVYQVRGDLVTINPVADGYRLPTEAEWEYAARSGGKGYQYGWGDARPSGNFSDSEVNARFSHWAGAGRYNDGFETTAPVAQFAQGELGLYSISGNVAEWCWDWYDPAYYQVPNLPRSPQGPDHGYYRVIRGGAWIGNPSFSRNSNRDVGKPTDKSSQIGFRIAKNFP